MDYKTLGSRIRSLRQKSGLQAELAERVDVTTAYIGQIERGERKFRYRNACEYCIHT